MLDLNFGRLRTSLRIPELQFIWLMAANKIPSVRFSRTDTQFMKSSSRVSKTSHTGEVESVAYGAHGEAEGSLRVPSELALDVSAADGGGQHAGALRRRRRARRRSESGDHKNRNELRVQTVLTWDPYSSHSWSSL